MALFVLLGITAASAQRYRAGERLYYRVAYRAKMVPNIEMAEVEIKTSLDKIDNRPVYHVYGNGRTMSIFKWFFDLNDTYRTWVDVETLRPLRFESNLYEGGYTYRSNYHYDWSKMKVQTWAQSRNNPPRTKTMQLTENSLDAVSLYFSLRSVDLKTFRTGDKASHAPHTLEMVLDDTVRVLHYRYIDREVCKVPHLGAFRTLKFACTIGSTEEFSFTDGSEFFMWISEDENKVPIMLESPIRVGSIRAYIREYEGLEHPMSSRVPK